jgi:hypothetical protein
MVKIIGGVVTVFILIIWGLAGLNGWSTEEAVGVFMHWALLIFLGSIIAGIAWIFRD